MTERTSVPTDPDDFRWQSFFQRSTDPLFLLNRQRRLLFVNRAWEALTGLPAGEARGLHCNKHQTASPGDSLKDVLAHALCPPPEAMHGHAARTRRLFLTTSPSTVGPRYWDVEFLPLRDGDHLRAILGRITPVPTTPAAAVPLPEKLVALRERAVGRYGIEWLASELPAMRRLAEQVRLAATLDSPALLVGEAGSGKETVARIIHCQSPRREKAFISLDCARLPVPAVCDLLFSNQTLAHRQAAGTIYFHEPQRLPADTQRNLVTLFTSPGAPRLLAGFRSNPAPKTQAQRLLPDLWCLLSVLVLRMPPLRERRADLPMLVEQFLLRAAPLAKTQVTDLTPAAWELLRAYSWPGNLDELYRVLASARLVADGRIDVPDFPVALRLADESGRAAEKPLPLDTLLAEAERRLIQVALQRARGKKKQAAALLGISVPRLLRRMYALKLIEGEPLAELELEEDE